MPFDMRSVLCQRPLKIRAIAACVVRDPKPSAIVSDAIVRNTIIVTSRHI